MAGNGGPQVAILRRAQAQYKESWLEPNRFRCAAEKIRIAAGKTQPSRFPQ